MTILLHFHVHIMIFNLPLAQVIQVIVNSKITGFCRQNGLKFCKIGNNNHGSYYCKGN